ncbi:MAG: NAD(P)/FAD-dependent oxidoreductase [Polyangiales bacterium]
MTTTPDAPKLRDAYDLVVLGAGNCGQAAAGIARAAGQSVLIVESRAVGGTCPLRGCVPKKVLVAAGEVLEAIRRAPEHGITVGPATVDWAKLIDREQGFVRGVPEQMEESLTKRGIDVAHARASFTARGTLDVGGKAITAKKFAICTGSTQRALHIAGEDRMVTSDQLLEDPVLPASIAFVGAGVIALEFAHVMARAGVKVTLLHNGARPLPRHEVACVDLLVAETRALGVDLVTEAKVVAVEPLGQRHRVRYEAKGKSVTLDVDRVANSAGRVADVIGLGLDVAQIAHEKERILVDEHLRSTSRPDVFVGGDAAAGRPQLSALATYDGKIIGHNLTKPDLRTADFSWIPSVIFTHPTLATVGLTEAAAKKAGRDVEIKENDMRSWRSARTYAETAAYAKVLIDRGSGKVVGAHVLGHGGAETIHAFALAMKLGLRASDLKDFVYAYPTFHSDVAHLV